MTRKYNNSSRSERDRNRYRSKSRTYHRKSKSHRKYSRDRNRRSRSSSYDNSKSRSRRPRRSKHNRQVKSSSSDYEPSDNELARKYYKKKEKRNEDQLASLLQDDKVKKLFEEFLKNKLNEPSNTNHELEYPEGRDQTSQEDQDRTRSQSRTQEENQDRTRSQSRTQEEAQDHTRSQSRTQEDQGRTRSQSRTQKDQGRSRGQSRTREGRSHSRGQSRTREDWGRSRGQSRTREDRGRSRTKPAVRSLRRNRFQRQAARDRSLRRIRSRTQSTSSSNLSHNDPKYIHINDLPQDFRNAIRVTKSCKQYNSSDHHEDFGSGYVSISEAIVYDMIHNRHKHQREEFLKKQKETSFQDEQARRKHMNSRRNDKRTNRANVIDHLKEIDDPLVKMFKIKELLPIKSNSLYYSPEISETDDENPGQRKIVTRDLKWRSSTERTKPFQASNWTISGYTGSLKTAVQKACMERSSNTLPARV
ncbi:hypothetical protein GLOIN_2v1773218 [Rhizophagus irregularis DAOM 181602=DAOM 197198]|nr:hypothetical protein GLOIN_2v1773218 [Rhizophagus irregularis DAOM 181602=DAOM 197198]